MVVRWFWHVFGDWYTVYSIMLILRNSGIFFLGERNLHDQVADPSCNAKEEPNVIVFQIWLFFFVFLQHVIDSSWISISPTNINVNPEMCRGWEMSYLEFKVPSNIGFFLEFQVWLCVWIAHCVFCRSWLTQIIRPLRCDLSHLWICLIFLTG